MINIEDLHARFKICLQKEGRQSRRQRLEMFLKSKGARRLMLLDPDHFLEAQALVQRWEAEDNGTAPILEFSPESKVIRTVKEIVYGKHGVMTLDLPSVFSSVFNKEKRVVLTINHEVMGAKELRDAAATMLEVAAYLEEANVG